MPTFKPTCRIRLQLRLDELDNTDAIRALLERDPPKDGAFSLGALSKTTVGAALADNLRKRTALEAIRTKIPRPELAKERSQLDKERTTLQRAQVGQGSTQILPQGLTESPADELNVLFEVLPSQVSISRNGLKDADTAKVTLDFRDVPIDPRVVRAALISISIGVVTADEWERGILGQRVRDSDGSLASLVEHSPGDELRFRSPVAFCGFVDEWLTEFGDDGDSAQLQCRDVSALLRDQRLPTGFAMSTDIPIAEAARQLIDAFPASRGLQVRYGTPTDTFDPFSTTAEADSPIIANALPEVLKKGKGKRGRQPKRHVDESVWDHIMEASLKLGLTPVVRGFTLFLLEPKVLFASFVNARRMVWGRNIKKLSFARKMGGVRSDTIEVRSPDPSIGYTRWARFPVLGDEPRSGILGFAGSPQPTTSRASQTTPNGMPQEVVQTLFVRGVADLATLERIAEQTFHEIARQEIEGAVETDEIESFDSREAGDLLHLLPGDPVTIEVAPPIEQAPVESGAVIGQQSVGGESGMRTTSSLQELQAQSVARRQAYLEELGMSPSTARRLALAQEQVVITSTFRANSVNIEFSAEDGVSMDFDFCNFIVVRESPNERDQQPKATTLSGAAALTNGFGGKFGL
ncbi:hypothetical protein UFOVP650_63 [uncultured Caudovirales phage]|uniref:Uncharacterized protein n=1 Tax=uncultured Caudovirales phage TaxID=2100421 RepID=A0A6J5N644_9CAUD|nr:hypothetical protein UFOVP650_63 [uncultured Caudovirales phage]